MKTVDQMSEAELDAILAAQENAKANITEADVDQMDEAQLDALLSQGEQTEELGDKYPWYESMAAGAGDAVTFGYGPNIVAAVKTGSVNSPEYIKKRDELNNTIREMQNEDPGSYYGGAAVGAIGSSLVLPGGAAIKGATTAAKLGRAAAFGAGAGFLADTPDPTGTTADLLSKEDLTSRGINTALGGAIGPAAEIGVDAIKKAIPNPVNRAFKALQPDRNMRRETRLAGEKVKNAVTNDVAEYGTVTPKTERLMRSTPTKENLVNFAKQEGILKGLPSLKVVYERSLEKSGQYGRELGELYKKAQGVIDDITHGGMDQKTIQFSLDHNQIASFQRLKNKIISKINAEDWAAVDKKGALQEIGFYFDDLMAGMEDMPDLLKLHEIKSAIGNKAYKVGKAQSPTNTEEFWRKAGRLVDEEIKSRIDKAAELSKNKGDELLGDQLRTLNHKYSMMRNIYDLSSNAVDSYGEDVAMGLSDVVNEFVKSPTTQMALSNTGAALQKLPAPSAKQIAIGTGSAIRPVIREPSPQELEAQIKRDSKLTQTQKAKLRDEIRKKNK